MSTDLMPGQMMALYIGRELPLLPISADLMPQEIVNDRRDRKVRGLVIIAVAIFTALLASFYLIARYQTSLAEQDLADAQAEVTTLTDKQQDFKELTETKEASKKITDQLKVLLANDLQWGPLLTSVRGLAPKDVLIKGITGALSDDGTAENPNNLPKTYEGKQIGYLNIVGTSPDKASIAALSEALGKVQGLGDPLVSEVASVEKGFRFGIRVDITSAALGGRYTPASASPSPSK